MMINPFEKVPLNIMRSFVRGTTHGGCAVYLPVNSRSDALMGIIREDLQKWLDSQPREVPITPLIA